MPKYRFTQERDEYIDLSLEIKFLNPQTRFRGVTTHTLANTVLVNYANHQKNIIKQFANHQVNQSFLTLSKLTKAFTDSLKLSRQLQVGNYCSRASCIQ